MSLVIEMYPQKYIVITKYLLLVDEKLKIYMVNISYFFFFNIGTTHQKHNVTTKRYK